MNEMLRRKKRRSSAIKKLLLMMMGCAAAIAVSAKIEPLMIGQPIPSGPVMTVEAQPFNLQDAAKEQRLAIIYYRGGWCPYCTMQLKQLTMIYDELNSMGYKILAISPDRPEKLRESLKKGPLSFTLLSDSSMKTAMAFGIAFKVDEPTLKVLEGYDLDIEEASGQTHHLLPVPSVFLVGRDGIIDFVYANPDYTVRLDPKVLLAAARAAMEQEEGHIAEEVSVGFW